MEYDTKNLKEIRVRDNCIILEYDTFNDAFSAWQKNFEKLMEDVEPIF